MGWEIIAVAIPLIIGAIAMWLKGKFSDHANAISSIEAGVLHAWEVFGKGRKAELRKEEADPEHERQDSKFEKEDISVLKDLAKNKAVEVMSSLSKGKKLDSVLDPSLWDLEIKKAVDRVKKKL